MTDGRDLILPPDLSDTTCNRMPMKNSIFALCAATIVVSSGSLFAETAPKQIDLSQFPAESVEDVVVPVPSEVFNVLDKLGSPNWKGEMQESLGKSSGNRAQVALLLGTVIAEGFIAVEAEDTERVKVIGREVLDLAAAINVRKAVVARSKSIMDLADAKDWPSVRRELDGALQDVRAAMTELNDEDLAQLVSLGGWLRGTEVLTSIVNKDYKRERAELLHQPELLLYFNRRLEAMSPRLRQSELITRIQSLLAEIEPLISEGGGQKISPESVEKIHTLTSEMVVSIRDSEA